MIILTWTSRDRNRWWTLDDVQLFRARTTGVFLIWYAGQSGRVVCVGQGDVAQQLAVLKEQADIRAHDANGELLVTWAQVSAPRIDGITRYLAETWSPLIEGALPDTAAIEVNSPGWIRPFV